MNATPTPYDGRADLIIREPIGRVFAQIQGHVRAGATVRPE